MNRYKTLMFALVYCLPTVAAQGLPDSDPRTDWQCAYPYSETNCQTILLAWSRDHQIPHEKIFDGVDCSGCEPTYYEDPFGRQHLLYAKCLNQFGGKFTRQDFVAPIHRYRESSGESDGWNIVSWRFEKCFETWECGDFCSLQSNPPTCLKYQSSNWGLYVPVLQGICSYGNGPAVLQNNESQALETFPTLSQPPQRDTTWEPVDP